MILPLDVTGVKCQAFTSAMDSVHALAVRSANQLRAPGEGLIRPQAIRPSPLVLRETLARARSFNPLETKRRKARNATRSPKLPRTSYTLYSSEPSHVEWGIETGLPIGFNTVLKSPPGKHSATGGSLWGGIGNVARTDTHQTGIQNTFGDSLKTKLLISQLNSLRYHR